MGSEMKFSAREMETLALAWQCIETDPKIDYAKLASLAGYTEGSAKTIMGGLKRKLKAHAASITNDGQEATPKKSNGGRPKKRTPDGDDDLANDASPSKKKKGGRKPKVAPKDEDEEFKDVKVKKEEVNGLGQDFDHEGSGEEF